MSKTLIAYRRDGDTLMPLAHHVRAFRTAFAEDRVYWLTEHKDRSGRSHRHFFAAVREAWQQLPEHLAPRFPSPDHLRAFALIKGGFKRDRVYPLASRDDALRLATYITSKDPFAVVDITDAVLTVSEAESQSEDAMEADRFELSKRAVLEIVASMIGVDVSALHRNTERAA